MVTKVHDHDDETFMKVMMVLMEQNYICQKTMGLFDNTFSKLCSYFQSTYKVVAMPCSEANHRDQAAKVS